MLRKISLKATGKRTLVILLTACLLLLGAPGINRTEAYTAPPWEPYKNYAVGDLASYSGIDYQCRQAHMSLPGWEPPNVPALWLEYGGSGTPSETVATPVFSPAGGTYSSSISVTISCATSGATIRYTTNGSEPTSSSSVYNAPVSITGTTTLKAKAFKSGMNNSATATAVYTIVTNPGNQQYPTWSSTAVYVGGDHVIWNGYIWRAEWWTQGEEPGTTGEWGVWRLVGPADPNPVDTVASPVFSPAGGTYQSPQVVTITCSTAGATIRYTTNGSEPNQSSAAYTGPITVSSTTVIKAKAFKAGMNDSPTVTATYTIGGDPGGSHDGFKIVGYYPSWKPDRTNRIQYDILTHINYAFAIPTADGGLLPLDNPSLATSIINQAHANGVKVLLAVGGWEYNGQILENVFVQATNTDAKIQSLTNAIVNMVNQYGFDGVDMDWEHPRTGMPSQTQYEKLMLSLRNALKPQGKLLTAAVLSGVSPDGIIYWDSAAHTDAVLNAVDWINVMAYDGGDGERHSSYQFAVNCGLYWRDTRNMPREKVVLGVPFYGRPSWASYDEILQANPNAYSTDVSMIYGMQAHYNGIPTIKAKTAWAKENLGGIMMWEISQDTLDRSKSLLSAIGEAAGL
jgi:GH18 family chitinase/chitodextrinase